MVDGVRVGTIRLAGSQGSSRTRSDDGAPSDRSTVAVRTAARQQRDSGGPDRGATASTCPLRLDGRAPEALRLQRHPRQSTGGEASPPRGRGCSTHSSSPHPQEPAMTTSTRSNQDVVPASSSTSPSCATGRLVAPSPRPHGRGGGRITGRRVPGRRRPRRRTRRARHRERSHRGGPVRLRDRLGRPGRTVGAVHGAAAALGRGARRGAGRERRRPGGARVVGPPRGRLGLAAGPVRTRAVDGWADPSRRWPAGGAVDALPGHRCHGPRRRRGRLPDRRHGDGRVDGLDAGSAGRRRRAPPAPELHRYRQPHRGRRGRRRRDGGQPRLDHPGRGPRHHDLRLRPCRPGLERGRRHPPGRRRDLDRPGHPAPPAPVCRAPTSWPATPSAASTR